LLYSVIYIIPLLLIVLVFTWSMGQRKVQAHEGQLLKLLAGVMMLMMGAILLFAPQYLSALPVIVGVMLLAILITLLAWLWERRKRV
jgi:drug/metabolite transporter (DMT)-like permease